MAQLFGSRTVGSCAIAYERPAQSHTTVALVLDDT